MSAQALPCCVRLRSLRKASVSDQRDQRIISSDDLFIFSSLLSVLAVAVQALAQYFCSFCLIFRRQFVHFYIQTCFVADTLRQAQGERVFLRLNSYPTSNPSQASNQCSCFADLVYGLIPHHASAGVLRLQF